MSEVEISGRPYEDAPECEKAVSTIISSEKFPEHKHLAFAKIKCLFKEKLSGYGWDNLGKVMKVNDLWWSLTDLDVLIIVNKTVWSCLGTTEKMTLMLHFLSKIKVYYKYNSKEKKTLTPPKDGASADFDITYSGRINYKIVPPDIEEFESVASRFGESYEKLKQASSIAKEG